MKQFIYITIILTSLSCKAQTIIPMYGGHEFDDNQNFYLKDVDNILNNYEGTWKWENGNDSFTLKLKKVEQAQEEPGALFEDVLVGEYEYTQDNAQLVNTLNLINDQSRLIFGHMLNNISFSYKYMRPRCEECDISERRPRMLISHPDVDDITAHIVLRHINDNGVEKLQGTLFYPDTIYVDPDRTDPIGLGIPRGEYVFIKQ